MKSYGWNSFWISFNYWRVSVKANSFFYYFIIMINWEVSIDKDEIIRRVRSLYLDLNEIWVTSSAALVLHGVKKNTRDIDLGASLNLWNELILKGYNYKQFENESKLFVGYFFLVYVC